MRKLSLLVNGVRSHFLLPASYTYDRLLMKPIRVHALPTSRCNFSCIACPCPGYRKHGEKDLSEEQWIAILRDLKGYLGAFHINFSGGEPFLHNGLLGMARFCSRNGIYMGATTNASRIGPENSDEIVEHFASLNISIDSLDPETNLKIRGKAHAGEIALDAISCLQESMKAKGKRLPIYLKVIVMRPNLAELPRLVELCRDVDLDGVMFQPLEIYPTFDAEKRAHLKKELWIDDLDSLRSVVEKLIALKKKRLPCLTDEETLRSLHLVYGANRVMHNPRRCYVGYNALMIGSDGHLQFTCNEADIGASLGSLTEHSIRELWEGEEAQRIRAKIKECRKTCLLTCKVERSLVQKAKIFFQLQKPCV